MPPDAAPPLFSVITPCLNRASSIGQAIESVLAQTDVTWEHIVADGGSTDGTLDVLARYPHVRVLRGPDAGLYDAINRGIRVAAGQFIVHLNSDDLLLPGALASALRVLAADPNADAACGGAVVAEAEADGTMREVLVYDDAGTKALSPYHLCRGVPIINARVFRRALYERVGVYDASYRYAGDRDFLLRAWAAGMRTAVIAERVYVYIQHPQSLTISGGPRRMVPWLDEHLRLAARWATDASAPAALRREAMNWYAHETGRAMLIDLRDGQLQGAMRRFLAGTRVDRLWPCRFLAAVARRFFGNSLATR